MYLIITLIKHQSQFSTYTANITSVNNQQRLEIIDLDATSKLESTITSTVYANRYSSLKILRLPIDKSSTRRRQ